MRSRDTPDFTMDASATVTERDLGLPGGVSVTLRSSGQVWSYPNMHGDVAVTADGAGAGAKRGVTHTYDPYGNTTGQSIVDNSAGNYDYGWLGEKQRGEEHETGLAGTIEMGARQYDPVVGRFLEVDPVEGGSANDYDYTSGDPVNGRDLDGNCGTWGNPWKKCKDPHRKRKGFLGGAFTKAGHAARSTYRHTAVNVTGCFIACLGIAFHHGHFGVVNGHGCCSFGLGFTHVKHPQSYRDNSHATLCAGYGVMYCLSHRSRFKYSGQGPGVSIGPGGGYSYTRTRWG